MEYRRSRNDEEMFKAALNLKDHNINTHLSLMVKYNQVQ